MKVRAGKVYVFQRSPLDAIHDCAKGAKDGDRVRVVQLRGCPSPNTMGQCHIETTDGKFLGMVSTDSLHPANLADLQKGKA